MADMRKYAGGGPEMQRVHHIREQMGSGWAGNPVDLHRAAQEEATRQIAQGGGDGGMLGAVPGLELAQERSISEHESIIRSISDSLNGSVAREAYMKRHRLRYEVGGILVQDPMREQTIGGGVAQMLRAPGKMFSRSDILAILRARVAAGTGIGPDGLHAAAVFEIQYLIKTFENLE